MSNLWSDKWLLAGAVCSVLTFGFCLVVLVLGVLGRLGDEVQPLDAGLGLLAVLGIIALVGLSIRSNIRAERAEQELFDLKMRLWRKELWRMTGDGDDG